MLSYLKDQWLFQVSSRDDITIDHLVEENREHAASRLDDLWGSTAEQHWSPEHCDFPLSERYEFEGR